MSPRTMIPKSIPKVMLRYVKIEMCISLIKSVAQKWISSTSTDGADVAFLMARLIRSNIQGFSSQLNIVTLFFEHVKRLSTSYNSNP